MFIYLFIYVFMFSGSLRNGVTNYLYSVTLNPRALNPKPYYSLNPKTVGAMALSVGVDIDATAFALLEQLPQNCSGWQALGGFPQFVEFGELQSVVLSSS